MHVKTIYTCDRCGKEFEMTNGIFRVCKPKRYLMNVFRPWCFTKIDMIYAMIARSRLNLGFAIPKPMYALINQIYQVKPRIFMMVC